MIQFCQNCWWERHMSLLQLWKKTWHMLNPNYGLEQNEGKSCRQKEKLELQIAALIDSVRKQTYHFTHKLLYRLCKVLYTKSGCCFSFSERIINSILLQGFFSSPATGINFDISELVQICLVTFFLIPHLCQCLLVQEVYSIF